MTPNRINNFNDLQMTLTLGKGRGGGVMRTLEPLFFSISCSQPSMLRNDSLFVRSNTTMMPKIDPIYQTFQKPWNAETPKSWNPKFLFCVTDAVSALVVGVGNSAVSLLASGVPNLQLDCAVVDLEGAEAEVHADRANVVLLKAVVLWDTRQIAKGHISCPVLGEYTYSEANEEAGLADAGVPDKHHFEEIVATDTDRLSKHKKEISLTILFSCLVFWL